MSSSKYKMFKLLNSFDSYSSKRVSYILITKNRDQFLKKALERIKQYKKRDDEFIVINGSPSGISREIINMFGKFIDKYVSEPDQSPANALNKAILLSEGKYIKYISDDDFFYKKGLEEAISVLEKNPEIEILECGGISYNKITKAVSTYYKPPGTNFGQNIDDMFRYRSGLMGLFIKRSVFAKVGLFSTVSGIEDAYFIANCFKAGLNIKFARIKIFKFIVHDSNTSINPKISKLIFNCVKENASKKYFLRYATNWYISRYPMLKLILSPVVFISNLFNNQRSTKQIYKWDGGFS